MTRPVKRERVGNGSRTNEAGDSQQLRAVKREKVSENRVHSDDAESAQESQQDPMDRRVLRSQYLKLINQINVERDNLSSVDSDKFSSIISEVENLHQLVQKPREQVADAEALLDIANTLVSSVKSQSNGGITPADFISGLYRDFGLPNRVMDTPENDPNSILWRDIGLAVSPVFRKFTGCCTMLGPMNTKLKLRKAATHRRRTNPTARARPEQVDDTGADEKKDTDKNMATMFEILRRKKLVRLESLILNRKSFAQTVENLFALSFLVKEGRVEITVDDNGSHLVSPKNAPAATSVMSGEVTYNHFVFRFDFRDWKLMMDVVQDGEELMLHREPSNTSPSQAEPAGYNNYAAMPTTPIRKFSRNRGLVIQEDLVVEESPDIGTGENGIRKCKRKLC